MVNGPDDNFDCAAAYEALVEFLYLAPVGIIKFLPGGTIEMANPAAAQLLMPLATDGDMSDIYALLRDLAPDLRQHVSRFEPANGQIFDQMQLAIPASGITLMLDINKIDPNTLMAVVQNVTDLTAARREVLRQTQSQRLLASVFMGINTPVAVVRSDGFILITNLAFQGLIGYDSMSLAGLNIAAILPPDCKGLARAARTQQMLDGSCYTVQMEVVSKDGTRICVSMNSSLLKGNDAKQSRVVTLVRDPSTAAGHSSGHQVNKVEVLSLAPMREAIGRDWDRISSRGMEIAEQSIKRLLRPSDILKRGENDSFIIWFADGDESSNAAILLRARQLVRRTFTTEFGSKIGALVQASSALDPGSALAAAALA